MHIYEIAVIGAGPAGIMAAIRAKELGKDIVLIEKNKRIGSKILITGKGRCNLTNTAFLDDFIEKFGKEGKFLRSAFSVFFNEEIIDFFNMNRVEKGIISKPKYLLWEMLANNYQLPVLKEYVRSTLKSRKNWRAVRQP